MTDCPDLIDDLHRLTRAQLALAMMAEVPAIAAMHIDLAVFGAEQSRVADELCD